MDQAVNELDAVTLFSEDDRTIEIVARDQQGLVSIFVRVGSEEVFLGETLWIRLKVDFSQAIRGQRHPEKIGGAKFIRLASLLFNNEDDTRIVWSILYSSVSFDYLLVTGGGGKLPPGGLKLPISLSDLERVVQLCVQRAG
jgi:hypothetical protein